MTPEEEEYELICIYAILSWIVVILSLLKIIFF